MLIMRQQIVTDLISCISLSPFVFFYSIHDACKLLTAARGTALLLVETLRSGQSAEEKTKPLHELRVLSLDSKQCVEVLERRTDIKMF